MKKIVLILYCILLVNAAASGQGAGYLGKHLILRTDIQYNFVAFYEVYKSDNIYLKINPSFGTDFLFSNKFSFGVTYKHFKSQFDFNQEYEYNRVVYTSWGWEEETFYFSSDAKGGINANYFGLNLKYYFLENIAPVSFNAKFELAIMPYKLIFDTQEVRNLSYYTNPPNWFPEKWQNPKFYEPVFTFSLGYQRVLFERLILHMSAQSSMNTKIVYFLIDRYNENNYLKIVPAKSLFLHSFVSFETGIGILLF